jgi:hypothetical protein
MRLMSLGLSLSILLAGISLPKFALALTITDSASGSSEPAQVAFPPAPGSVVNGDFLLEPNPGCTGPQTNCGFTGDGINDQTTWIFDFTQDPDYGAFLASGTLTSASLSLTLTVREMQISTDVVRIRGLDNITAQIQQLVVGQTASITFDLLDFYTSNAILGNLDSTLVGGTVPKNAGELLMLYQDDAVVSSASLSLSTDVPEPAVAVLMLAAMVLGLARTARAADLS